MSLVSQSKLGPIWLWDQRHLLLGQLLMSATQYLFSTGAASALEMAAILKKANKMIAIALYILLFLNKIMLHLPQQKAWK